jgi:hypothetical protein
MNMSEQPRDLKLRTKAFALRIIRMYSKLPKNHNVAQVLGKQVLRSGTSVVRTPKASKYMTFPIRIRRFTSALNL